MPAGTAPPDPYRDPIIIALYAVVRSAIDFGLVIDPVTRAAFDAAGELVDQLKNEPEPDR